MSAGGVLADFCGLSKRIGEAAAEDAQSDSCALGSSSPMSQAVVMKLPEHDRPCGLPDLRVTLKLYRFVAWGQIIGRTHKASDLVHKTKKKQLFTLIYQEFWLVIALLF